MQFKKFDDYIDKVAEKFPTIPKKSIRRILEFGSRSFYMHNYYGGDILLKSPYFTLYCGKVFSNNLMFYSYWTLKYQIKYRFMYARSKQKYSGYYYFGLTEEEYKEYMNQFSSKSKRRKKVTFENIYLFKLLNECVLFRQYKHFFRVPIKEEGTFRIRTEKLETRNYEYLGKRSGDQTIDYVNYEKRSK